MRFTQSVSLHSVSLYTRVLGVRRCWMVTREQHNLDDHRGSSPEMVVTGGVGLRRGANQRRVSDPQKALCGGIPSPFLEPSPRSWSHFVGVYRQILTTSLKN